LSPPLDDDIVMADAQKPIFDDSDSAYVSDEDSPEMKELKREDRQQPYDRSEDGNLKIPTTKSLTLKSAEAMLKSDYTVHSSGAILLIACMLTFIKGYSMRREVAS
jgi:hypothetical protein